MCEAPRAGVREPARQGCRAGCDRSSGNVRFELLGKEGVAVLRALGSEQPTGGGGSDPAE